MRKLFGKIVVLMMTAVMLFGSVACNDSGWGNGGPGGGSSSGTLRIIIREAGFGTDWLYNLTDAYTAKTGTPVKVSESYVVGEIRSLAASGQLYYDLARDAGTWDSAVDVPCALIDCKILI